MDTESGIQLPKQTSLLPPENRRKDTGLADLPQHLPMICASQENASPYAYHPLAGILLFFSVIDIISAKKGLKMVALPSVCMDARKLKAW